MKINGVATVVRTMITANIVTVMIMAHIGAAVGMVVGTYFVPVKF